MNKKLLLASLIAISPLLADDCCPQVFDSCLCEPGPETARFTLRSRQPGGIGYPTGYTSFDLFYAPGTRGNFTPFIDLRAHVFNDGKPAFNTGLGLRYLPECNDVVYGINAYWDYRQAKHASFNQVGLGLEALWTHWDLHLNGYAPVSRHKKSYRTGFQGFQGNEAFFYKKYELAMWGGDLALGYQFYSCNWFDLHATLDGYYFQGDYGEHAGGGFFRLRSNVCDYVTVEGQVSYDSLFKWNGQGELAINFAFGKTVKRYPRKTSCCNDILALEKHLVEKPDRFEIMPTTSHKKRGRALDPTTGLPLRFLFVDNTSHSAGTFESPYSTLAQASAASFAGDVIYIFPGDGTSTGLNTTTTLKDRQSLVGSGAPFEVATRFGNLVIPQLSATLPFIDVATNNAVIPISNNTISGLKIFARNNNAIQNPLLPVSNLSVLKCTVGGNSVAIYLPLGLGGVVNIEDNRLFSFDLIKGTAASFSSINNDQGVILFRRNILDGTPFGMPLVDGLSAFSLNNSQLQIYCENNQFIFSGTAISNFTQGTSKLQSFVRENDLKSVANITLGLSYNSNSTSILEATAELNRISAPSATNSGIFALASTNSTLLLRMNKNQVNIPVGSPITLQELGGGTFILESPNGLLSGVQNINVGQITSSGNIQFAPLQ